MFISFYVDFYSTMDVNLNNKFNNLLSNIDLNNKPNLFLHVCCGPCSLGVIQKLSNYFNIYIIFYNSNIDTFIEYNLRLYELKKIIKTLNFNFKIIYYEYNHDEFLNYIEGLEDEPEGGIRCKKCFELRLLNSVRIANEFIIDNNMTYNTNYLCTTLSVSPHKNAEMIEEIGEKICKSYKNIEYLPSDFKKEDGYLNSVKLSKKYGVYRQSFCGCEFSKCIK